ncbi:MAG: hydrogenase expression/formation protein HypE [Planctomycetia bacterium]|jgi:hydrogenase expression/formation protein HypE
MELNCPLPKSDHDTVQMAHGGGGRMMRQLIEKVFLPGFATGDPAKAAPAHDSAVLNTPAGRIAMTTDTFVVDPLFFPGGDIGHLAVCGTVNDLAMAGARPLALSCGFVLEEGFSLEKLEQIVQSMKRTADEVGVPIVTGDTKVVDRGRGDGVYINTAGVGLLDDGVDISPARIQTGDAILVTGDLGRHGIAVMSVREGLNFEGAPESDCASLVDLVQTVLEADHDIHCMRDLTRGGLASAMCELAIDAKVGIRLEEAAIPVLPSVNGVCELLGLDPLYVANEGRMTIFVPAEAAEVMLAILESHPAAVGPAIIGQVVEDHPGTVEMHNTLGARRIIDFLSGEQMPRIC